MMFCAPFSFQPVMRHAGAVPMAHGNASLHRPQEERQGHHCHRTWGKCLSWKSDPGLLETKNLLLGSWKRASPVVPLLCSVSLAWYRTLNVYFQYLSMVSAKQRGHFCRTSSAELLARGLIANSEPGSLESSEMALGSSLCPTRPPAVRGVLRRLTEKVQRVAAKG